MKTWISSLLLLAMSLSAIAADMPQTDFGDGGSHDVAYPAAADGRGTFRVSGHTVVNLLEGGWGSLDLRGNATLNVRGGTVGPASGQASHRLRGEAVLNFHAGAIQRRFVQLSDNATMTVHGTGHFEHLQQIELRSGAPTLTFYLHEDFSERKDVTIRTQSFVGATWTEFDEYFDPDGTLHLAKGSRKEGGRIHTQLRVAATLPGASEPTEWTVAVFDDHPLRNDEDGAGSTRRPPRERFGIHERFINFDGSVKTGHINFVPAAARPSHDAE